MSFDDDDVQVVDDGPAATAGHRGRRSDGNGNGFDSDGDVNEPAGRRRRVSSLVSAEVSAAVLLAADAAVCVLAALSQWGTARRVNGVSAPQLCADVLTRVVVGGGVDVLTPVDSLESHRLTGPLLLCRWNTHRAAGFADSTAECAAALLASCFRLRCDYDAASVTTAALSAATSMLRSCVAVSRAVEAVDAVAARCVWTATADATKTRGGIATALVETVRDARKPLRIGDAVALLLSLPTDVEVADLRLRLVRFAAQRCCRCGSACQLRVIRCVLRLLAGVRVVPSSPHSVRAWR
jgi:hypothetical protein